MGCWEALCSADSALLTAYPMVLLACASRHLPAPRNYGVCFAHDCLTHDVTSTTAYLLHLMSRLLPWHRQRTWNMQAIPKPMHEEMGFIRVLASHPTGPRVEWVMSAPNGVTTIEVGCDARFSRISQHLAPQGHIMLHILVTSIKLSEIHWLTHACRMGPYLHRCSSATCVSAATSTLHLICCQHRRVSWTCSATPSRCTRCASAAPPPRAPRTSPSSPAATRCAWGLRWQWLCMAADTGRLLSFRAHADNVDARLLPSCPAAACRHPSQPAAILCPRSTLVSVDQDQLRAHAGSCLEPTCSSP